MNFEIGSSGTTCSSSTRSGSHPCVSWSRATFTHTESAPCEGTFTTRATTSLSGAPTFTLSKGSWAYSSCSGMGGKVASDSESTVWKL